MMLVGFATMHNGLLQLEFKSSVLVKIITTMVAKNNFFLGFKLALRLFVYVLILLKAIKWKSQRNL